MAKSSPKLALATTTSVHDSGLLDALCAEFTKVCGVEVEVQVVGTGAALRLGRSGEVDAVIVHNAIAELQFMEAGHGVNRREFMINDFVLVGAPHDPAGAGGAKYVFDALACIFREGALFYSRGDDSGTNLRELELWSASPAVPFGQPWYRAIGGGMINCLEAASADGAYTLADSGTFLAQAGRLALQVICADPEHLRNAYSVIVINPARHSRHSRHSDEGHAMAGAFTDFLTGKAGQELIDGFRNGRQPLFAPLWPSCKPAAPGRREQQGQQVGGGSRGSRRPSKGGGCDRNN
jgi:tungstate transport system substrate-binding protein